MKTLLFVPKRYSLFDVFKDIFTSQGSEVYTVDYYQFVKKWETKLNAQIFRFPDKYRLKWESYYFERINAYYIEEYNKVKPDIVFVYNNEMILPETMHYFKKKSKVAFFLGDHPFYTPTSRYDLPLLFAADAIFSPDTFWISQLAKMGLKNLHFFNTGIPEDLYFEKELTQEELDQWKRDILYVGLNYTGSWGYKKARFMSHLTEFDLRIYGNKHWKRWFPFFPALEKCFVERDGYIPVEQMNTMFNAAKIIPIDGNPGLQHGLHIRMFEALGAGALPLLEWQNDLTEIFGEGADLPAAKSYDEIKEIAAYYLNNEAARREKVRWMKQIVLERFSIVNNANLIFEALGLKQGVSVSN